jgi:two-component system CheB/CheR fusion protein
MPYRTTDDRIEGLVITFNDISISKKLEMELTKANQDLMEAKKAHDLKHNKKEKKQTPE